MELSIVRATARNAAELGAVHAAAWRAAYKEIVPKTNLAAFTPKSRAAVFGESIGQNPALEYYLFRGDGAAAGLALLGPSHEAAAPPSAGELYAIYFSPEYWGGPLPAAAFRFCELRLLERGFTELSLWVLEQNARARRFYEKQGYSPSGARANIDLGAPLTQLRYVKQP